AGGQRGECAERDPPGSRAAPNRAQLGRGTTSARAPERELPGIAGGQVARVRSYLAARQGAEPERVGRSGLLAGGGSLAPTSERAARAGAAGARALERGVPGGGGSQITYASP